MALDAVDYDVVIVGAGPVGLFAASLLSRRGRRVAVIERHERPFTLPRAGHIDGEVLRALQSVGAHRAVLDDATPYGDYTWYNGDGEKLFVIDFAGKSSSFWFSDYTIYQPSLEEAVVASWRSENVEALFATEVQGVVQSVDAVELACSRVVRDVDGRRIGAGEGFTVRAKWVVAADGANSSVREALGVSSIDYGFNERWLIVDAAIEQRWDTEAQGAQYCDPSRPAFETPLGTRHHRWEFAALPGETDEQLEAPETAWRLLAARGIGPSQVTIVRRQVYTFGSRIAETWRVGRVLLAGDAAHTMPPFMGQGMCAGIRDALNLAWKLDGVLAGRYRSTILDSYEAERRPHAQTWAEISRIVGSISCTTDPAEAAARDQRFREGAALEIPPFPELVDRVFGLETDPLAGTLFPQGLVGFPAPSLFDDAIEQQYVLVLAGPWPLPIPSDKREALDREGVRIVRIGPGTDGIADLDGTYYRYFAQHRLAAVLVRPDRHVGAALRTPRDLARALDALAALRV